MCCQKNWNLFRRLKILLLRVPLRNHPVRFASTPPIHWRGISPVSLLSALLLFCFFTFTSCDKEELIVNSWNLRTVLKNGEPYTDTMQFHLIPKKTNYSFYYSQTGSLFVKTYALNQLATSADGIYYFKDKSTIWMRFTLLYKRCEIEAKIKKLNGRELNLEYKDKEGDTYFMKLYAN